PGPPGAHAGSAPARPRGTTAGRATGSPTRRGGVSRAFSVGHPRAVPGACRSLAAAVGARADVAALYSVQRRAQATQAERLARLRKSADAAILRGGAKHESERTVWHDSSVAEGATVSDFSTRHQYISC